MRWKGSLLVLGVAVIALCGSHDASAATVLKAIYDPADGTVTMRSVDDTSGAPAPLSISTFQFLSPNLLLSGTAAAIPASAASFATVLNTSTSTLVDPPSVHAEIYATNFGGGTPLFTSVWNLGAVAATGLSQGQVNLGFTTDPDISPGGVAIPGAFLYQVQGEFEFKAGQITAVPEPSSLALLASALAVAGAWRWRRQRA